MTPSSGKRTSSVHPASLNFLRLHNLKLIIAVFFIFVNQLHFKVISRQSKCNISYFTIAEPTILRSPLLHSILFVSYFWQWWIQMKQSNILHSYWKWNPFWFSSSLSLSLSFSRRGTQEKEERVILTSFRNQKSQQEFFRLLAWPSCFFDREVNGMKRRLKGERERENKVKGGKLQKKEMGIQVKRKGTQKGRKRLSDRYVIHHELDASRNEKTERKRVKEKKEGKRRREMDTSHALAFISFFLFFLLLHPSPPILISLQAYRVSTIFCFSNFYMWFFGREEGRRNGRVKGRG